MSSDDAKRREELAALREALQDGRAVPLSDEFCGGIVDLLRERHPRLRAADRVELSGELGHGHTLVELMLENPDATMRADVGVVVESDPNDLDNPLQARDAALDYLDTIVADYLENDRRLRLLPGWDVHEVEGLRLKVRGEVSNPTVEARADEFLAEHGFDPDGHPVGEGEPS